MKIVKQEIKDLYIHSSIIFEFDMVLLHFPKEGVFSSFLIFSNAFFFSMRKLSNYLVHYYKSSLDVSKILASFLSVVGFSSFHMGVLLVTRTSVHLELSYQSIQNQSLKQWKQMIVFEAPVLSVTFKCLHQQYWNWCLLSTYSYNTCFRYVSKT